MPPFVNTTPAAVPPKARELYAKIWLPSAIRVPANVLAPDKPKYAEPFVPLAVKPAPLPPSLMTALMVSSVFVLKFKARLVPPSDRLPLMAAAPPLTALTLTLLFKMSRPPRPLSTSAPSQSCLLYTSDAADDLLCVDLGGRRIIKKKKKKKQKSI